jgi:hypothetical protein
MELVRLRVASQPVRSEKASRKIKLIWPKIFMVSSLPCIVINWFATIMWV